MQEIIYKHERKITREMLRYQDAAERLQKHVNQLRTIGLTVTMGDISDLLHGGRALLDQTIQKSGFRPSYEAMMNPKKRFEEQEASESAARRFLNPITEKIKTVLSFESSRFSPLRMEAFEIVRGQVSLTDGLEEEIAEGYTIYATPERTEALKLCQDVKNAIDALNKYVENKRMFKSGFGISGSTYRTLANINEDWAFEINLEEFNYL